MHAKAWAVLYISLLVPDFTIMRLSGKCTESRNIWLKTNSSYLCYGNYTHNGSPGYHQQPMSQVACSGLFLLICDIHV